MKIKSKKYQFYYFITPPKQSLTSDCSAIGAVTLTQYYLNY